MRKELVVLSAAVAMVFAAGGAHANVIGDLTSLGAEATIDNAIYRQIDPQSTGTGLIDPFVQVQTGGSTPTESAYNTTVNGTLDVGEPDNFNHAITIADIPFVDVGGTLYAQFVLDINESDGGPANDRFLSLDDVQLFLDGTANSSTESVVGGVLQHDGDLVYRLDTGMDNWIALDFQLGSGSGSGDMELLINADVFDGYDNDTNVVLYSVFGLQGVDPGDFEGNFGASDGPEEWTFAEGGEGRPDEGGGEEGGGEGEPIPEPTTVALLGMGLAGMAANRARRKRA